MKIIGIIAEYNPFHNGHAYQIEKIKKDFEADFIIVAMSGDFVQRGTPAILDKYTRAKMALCCGADLVIELPVLWATASAESFAMAGVTLFDKLGCVDGICFGAETDDSALLDILASILVEEPDAYKQALSQALKEGKSFPLARAEAISLFLAQHPESFSNSPAEVKNNSLLKNVDALLSSPNNILAIEYLKAIKRRGSSLKAYPLKREGADYHASDIPSTDFFSAKHSSGAFPIASATGIRNILLKNVSAFTEHLKAEAPVLPASLTQSMPKAALSVLTDYLSCHPLVTADDFSAQLSYQLLLHRTEGFSDIMDCNTEISNRICGNIPNYLSFSDFCENNKSRNITYTRMSRILLHLLLDITKDLEELGKEFDYIPYLRLLGFRKPQSPEVSTTPFFPTQTGLFSLLKETASVPLISKLSASAGLLSEEALTLLKKDIFAADFYEQVKAALSNEKTAFPTEYSRKIVIL